MARSLPLGRDQTNDLTASCDQIGQGLGVGIRPRATLISEMLGSSRETTITDFKGRNAIIQAKQRV